MKIEPIVNPHARIGQITKKTKAEEKDELIATTKMNVIEKYARKSLTKKAHQQQAQTGATGPGQTTGQSNNFKDKSEFALADKISPEKLGIQLLLGGYIKAYVDFFYLTHETTPSAIEPSPALLKEYQMKKRTKKSLDQTPEMLTLLSNSLIDGEQYWREGEARKAFKTYLAVGNIYEEL